MTDDEKALTTAFEQLLGFWQNDDEEIVDVVRKSEKWAEVRFGFDDVVYRCVY
jgi:hypothetical protein